jgi:hypothetical protein
MRAVAEQFTKVGDLVDVEVRGSGGVGLTTADALAICNKVRTLTRLCLSHNWGGAAADLLRRPKVMTAFTTVTIEFDSLQGEACTGWQSACLGCHLSQSSSCTT